MPADMQAWRAEMLMHVAAIMQRALRHHSDVAEAVFAVSTAQRALLLMAPVRNDVPATRQAACDLLVRLMREWKIPDQEHVERGGIAFLGSLLSRLSDYTIDPRDI